MVRINNRAQDRFGPKRAKPSSFAEHQTVPVTPRLLMADFRRLIAIAIIRPEPQHGSAALIA